MIEATFPYKFITGGWMNEERAGFTIKHVELMSIS